MDIVQLLAGMVTLPEMHPTRAGDPYPLYAYLITHPDGPVLVDTGCGPGHPWIDDHFAPQDIPIAGALQAVGVDPSEVRMLIHTHLHFDHCGQNRAFPGIPVMVQSAEYEAAKVEGFTVPEWLGFDEFNWQCLEGEVEVAPGITTLPTASHTPGHQAIVVATDHGLEIIAGQALQDPDEFEAEAPKDDLPKAGPEGFEVVAQRIKARGPARVWFSHDERVWAPS